MCINAGYCLPCNDIRSMLIALDSGVLKIHVKIRRLEKVDDFLYTIGIELLSPPMEYLKFVSRQRTLIKSMKGFRCNKTYRLFNYDV